MSVRLEDLIEATRVRLDERKRARPFAELEVMIGEAPRCLPFAEALSRPGTSVIAEHKRRSPSAGTLREGASVTEIVRAYERGGAAALSILTEQDHFGGSLDDLAEARRVSDIPILRKDFTIDPYQVYEARAWGADAVLLVVGALEIRELGMLHGIARELEMDVIVEVHNEEELNAALDIDADVIGINNRDLEDFSVDLQVTLDLLVDVPTGKTVVSESGIHTRSDVEELEQVGVDAVLVGEALMRSPDPEAACRDLARTEEPTQA
jgi:indole-3-glycerol phosphate synthase